MSQSKQKKSEQLTQTRVAVTCLVSEVEGEDDGPAMAVGRSWWDYWLKYVESEKWVLLALVDDVGTVQNQK